MVGLAVIADREHYFCTCERVSAMWIKIKQILHVLLLDCDSLRDLDLLTLNIPRQQTIKEAVWLIGNYIHMIWVSNLEHLSSDQLFGFLKFKYKEDSHYISMGNIPGLN